MRSMDSWFLIVGGIAIFAGFWLAWTLAGGEVRWYRRTFTRREHPGIFWLAVSQNVLVLALTLFMIWKAAPNFGR
jgi:hypothetical protein